VSLNDEKARGAMMDPKLTMEVPQQVREFAEKSVDQAERAISSFMESASKSVAMVPGPMTDVARQALAITEANLKASFDHARKLMQAKDITEVMQLQSEFLKAQFGAATDQFKQVTSGMSSAGKETGTI
jgi:phasin